MKASYKNLIREILEEADITIISFGTLPDSKTVNTISGLGYYGSISAKSWPELYKKIRRELKEI